MHTRSSGRLALCCLAASLLVCGCDLVNPFDEARLILQLDPAPTLVTGQIVDAATGQVIPVSPALPLTIRFSGPEASRVVDEAATPFASRTLTITGGPSFVSFGMVGTVPTLAAPASIHLMVSAPGYLTTSVPLLLTDSTETFRVALVHLSAPPPGVGYAQETGTASGTGMLQTALHAATPENATTDLQASITLPANTVLRDANDQPLTGTLTATAASFDPRQDPAEAAFPGGFTGVRPDDNPAGAGPGTFLTAGFAAFEITDESGRAAKRFDGPATVSIEIPEGLLNPETGRPVQPGDEVPIYSLSTDAGGWQFEGSAPATGPDTQGNLRVAFTTTHLSYYHLAWFQPAGCSASSPVDVHLPDGALASEYYAQLLLGQSDRLLTTISLDGAPLRFKYAPTLGGRLVFYRAGEQAPLVTFVTNNLCSGGTVAVPGGARPRTTVHLVGQVSCSQKRLTVRPSTHLYFRRTDGEDVWSALPVRHGDAQIAGLVAGAEYEVGTFLNGQWKSTFVRLSTTASQPVGVVVVETGPDTFEMQVEYQGDTSQFCQ